jgi:SAM-dependent methyltransferase
VSRKPAATGEHVAGAIMATVPLFEDRSRAESFGSVADLYDRARPTYPPVLIGAVLADGGRTVLDVGCGTGIASALFAARGCSVTGVEVDERMAEIARAKGLEVEVSTFERWDDRGRRFDVVASGQAWHWIGPTAGAIRAADVLRGHGRLGAFWNFGDPPAEVRGRLARIYDRLAPELVNYSVVLDAEQRDERIDLTVSGIADSTRFGPIEVRHFPWVRTYRAHEWTDFLATHSDHQALEPGRRAQLLDEVADVVDAIGGTFEMPFETALVTAARE